MILPQFPKWIRFLRKNLKFVGIFFSMAFASYKAWDNRRLYIQSNTRNERLEDRLEDKNTLISTLEKEKNETQSTLKSVLYNIAAANMGYDQIPLPMWYKLYDKGAEMFKMVYINRAYEKVYNVNRIEYLGNLDSNIHGSSISGVYAEHDWEAYNSETPVYAEEPSIDGKVLEVVKWRVDKGDSIFIYGMIIKTK